MFFEDVRLAGRGMQTGLLCLWKMYRTRPAISFVDAPLLFWHNLFLRQAKAIREDPLLVHWRYQKPSTPNIIHMFTRYYSGNYRVSKQKSTRDSRSTSCKQLMKNEQSHLESNTSGIFRIVINATWSNMLDNRQTAGAQGEQHFRHSRRWTSDVEFGPGLFWQAGLVCAKYFVFFGDTRSLQYSSAFWSVRVLPMSVLSNAGMIWTTQSRTSVRFGQKHQSNCWLWERSDTTARLDVR